MDKKRQFMGGRVAWKFHSIRYNMQWRNTADLWIRAAALPEYVKGGNKEIRITTIQARAKEGSATLGQTLQTSLLLQYHLCFQLNSLRITPPIWYYCGPSCWQSCQTACLEEWSLCFFLPSTHKHKAAFFFLADISVFFGESIIKASFPPFSSMYRCQSLQFCSSGWIDEY